MPDDAVTLPGIGHNQGPLYDAEQHEGFTAKAKEFGKGSIAWGESGVNSDADAEKLNDFITGVSGLIKEIDKARAAAKKPYDDAAKEIQAAFKPKLIDPLTKMKEKASALLTAYQRKREDEERERLLKAQEEAEAAKRAAEEAARKADESGDVIEAAEMEERTKEAEKTIKDASKGPDVKIGSTSGAGRTFARRKETVVTVANPRLLAAHYIAKADPEFMDCLQRLANRDVRAKAVDHTQIPGIEVEVQ